MKILISSHAFLPSVGGVEEVSDLVAREFVAMGHSVKVVTMTPNEAPDTFPFEVVRCPGPRALINCVRWCDAFLQMNVSFQFAWPLILAPRPWIVANHMSLHSAVKLKDRLREAIARTSLRFARVTAISEAVTPGTPKNTTIVTNPYRTEVFHRISGEQRTRDLVFVGRLVDVKGLTYLFDAMAKLRERGLTPHLTIVGNGPDEARLRACCTKLNLDSQVTFAGYIPNGPEMARLLNQSRIMVLPSMWEGLPLSVLQAIACGCAIVASDTDGLPEAVGPCGLVFPKGDSDALADQLAELLRSDGKRLALRQYAPGHLARHQPRAVAEAYLSVIEEACNSSTRRSDRRAAAAVAASKSANVHALGQIQPTPAMHPSNLVTDAPTDASAARVGELRKVGR